jgi:hypothetical protein
VCRFDEKVSKMAGLKKSPVLSSVAGKPASVFIRKTSVVKQKTEGTGRKDKLTLLIIPTTRYVKLHFDSEEIL